MPKPPKMTPAKEDFDFDASVRRFVNGKSTYAEAAKPGSTSAASSEGRPQKNKSIGL